jgi:hypothetical protein
VLFVLLAIVCSVLLAIVLSVLLVIVLSFLLAIVLFVLLAIVCSVLLAIVLSVLLVIVLSVLLAIVLLVLLAIVLFDLWILITTLVWSNSSYQRILDKSNIMGATSEAVTFKEHPSSPKVIRVCVTQYLALCVVFIGQLFVFFFASLYCSLSLELCLWYLQPYLSFISIFG